MILMKKLEGLESSFGGVRHIKNKTTDKVNRGGDRMNSQYHQYAYIYSRYLKNLLDKNIFIAEVGILDGVGLAIWCEIFPNANIHGYDIDINNFNKNLNNLKSLNAFRYNKPLVFTFDQSQDNTNFISKVMGQNKYTVVIDDGAHTDTLILQTFKSFLPFLAEDFIYFIEDNTNIVNIMRKQYPNYMFSYHNDMTVITPKHQYSFI